MEIVHKLRQLGATKFGSYVIVCGVFIVFCSMVICILLESIGKGIVRGIHDGAEEISDAWDIVGPALKPSIMREYMAEAIEKTEKKNMRMSDYDSREY